MTNLSDLLKEFEEKLKNPDNTGYRVGQEYIGAVELFIEKSIRQVIEECEPKKDDCSDRGYTTQYERQIFRNAQNEIIADYKEKVKAFLENEK